MSFLTDLAQSWPPEDWREVTVLVAVSGGADSVALLRGLSQLKQGGRGRLIAAHFNHGWRGAESHADEAFVGELCGQLELILQIGRSTASASALAGDGLEAAARAERYAFLQSAAERLGARYLVTAHTADDQAETILHHIVRGTGLPGLAGMQRARPLSAAVTLMRPLLAVRRSAVVEYLRQIGQAWREDASNEDLRFTRNRIRRELLPQLATHYNSGVVEALTRLGSLAADAQLLIDERVAELMAAHVTVDPIGSVAIGCATFGEHDRPLVRELLIAVWRAQGWPLQAMGYAQWNQLADMALAKRPRRITLPGAVSAQKRGQWLELAPIIDLG